MLPKPTDLEALRGTQERGPRLEPQLAARLDEKADQAIRRLQELDEKRLVVGFLGGTGVGKSTLMNAIAGATISRPGDRRPTTDRVICYRHVDFPIPPWLEAADLADPPPPHELDGLRGVTLLDLPDLDSRATQHRELVHRALPHLDVLLVVTSVDKYGDDLLYQELRSLPQAPRNLMFVLNAIDRVQPAEHDAVVQDFRDKLGRYTEHQSPQLYVISALQAFQGEPVADFEELTSLLDRLGGNAERKAVLAANANAAVTQLVEEWRTNFPPDELQPWLDSLAQVPVQLPTVSLGSQGALQTHLEDTLRPWVKDRALRASWFPIGPLHFAMQLFGRSKRRSHKDPFLANTDPCAAFAEECLFRPGRLAHHLAVERLREQEHRVSVPLPSADCIRRGAPAEATHSWAESIRRRVPRWGWKFRQHILPGSLLLALVAWLVASFLPEPGSEEGWISALWSGLVSTAQSMSPWTLGALGLSLILYYLLVYPYFLYRLEDRLANLAKSGVRAYLRGWESAFRADWGEPVEKELTSLRAWWKSTDQLLAKLTRRVRQPTA